MTWAGTILHSLAAAVGFLLGLLLGVLMLLVAFWPMWLVVAISYAGSELLF